MDNVDVVLSQRSIPVKRKDIRPIVAPITTIGWSRMRRRRKKPPNVSVFPPAIIVSISYYKTGKDEEKIYGKITVVYEIYCRFTTGKLKTFKNVIPHNKKGCHASQSVKKWIMRL